MASTHRVYRFSNFHPFAVSFATAPWGQNYAIGPVGVLTIAATYLILGRTLDPTRNFIREERS